jgi:ethanolamine utilization protein EutA
VDQSRQLLSVGIDIGTTTTQLVFSNLSIHDVARPGQIPRIDITDRKVLYQSEIIFTPLVDEDTIDVVRLVDFIRSQYAAAGVMPSQVETGAAIITGETAKKKNADEILKAAAGLSGDFVVTVAGPNVESIAAGRGSGASEYSRQHFNAVTNIDIGGGSANSAQFRQGQLVTTAAMNYGGRVIELADGSGLVRHITKPGRILCEQLGFSFQAGDRVDLASLQKICDLMCDLTLELVEGTTSTTGSKLYLTPPATVSGKGKPLLFSGGVGRCYYENDEHLTLSTLASYGDIGPLLAERMHLHAGLQQYTIVRPPETMRATVLGAASQLITLSGSTIWAEPGILPLRNVPVVRPVLDPQDPTHEFISAVELALQRWDIHPLEDPFAIVLDLSRPLDFNSLNQLAQAISGFANRLPASRPLLIVVRRDYAQSLGQTLRARQEPHPLLIIDQVGLEEGDYIDIGQPLLDGRVVPLSVKTLIFYHN